MAVPKKRTGKSAQATRRANWKATKPEVNTCPNCGEFVLAHTVCTACGYYKGKPVSIKDAAKVVEEKAEKKTKKAAKKVEEVAETKVEEKTAEVKEVKPAKKTTKKTEEKTEVKAEKKTTKKAAKEEKAE